MNQKTVYRFATPYDPSANILYVNVVPRYSCTNECRFCSRKNAVAGKANIYERKAGTKLWLPKTPLVEDVMHELENERTDETNEIAFVGLGEPLLQFEQVRGVITRIRTSGFQGKVRIDTNGLVKCWHKGNPAQELRDAGLDEIRISVNATDEEAYAATSRPRPKDAFQKLCDFVKDCIDVGIGTFVSFVVGFDDGTVRTRTAEEYITFAKKEFDLKSDHVIIRQYVPPITENQNRQT